MNSQTPAPLAQTSRACDTYTADFAETGEGGDLGWIRFYPRRKDTSTTQYYYVIKLSTDFTLANVEVRNPDYCSDTYHN